MIKKLLKWVSAKIGEALIQHAVLAGIVSLGGLAAAAAYFWDTTKQVFFALRFFFLAPVTFPTWLILPIIVVALCTMAFLLFIVRAARLADKKAEDVTEVINNYTQDTFEGMVWRWRWYGNMPSDFTPYCPKCDCTLTKGYSGMRHFGQTLHFDCPNCRFHKEIDSDKDMFEIKLTQLIEYRSRKKAEDSSEAS